MQVGLKEGVGVVNDVTVGEEEERCGDMGGGELLRCNRLEWR